MKTAIERATTQRDQVAHGIFMRHPGDGSLFLRLTRGKWEASLTGPERVNRAIYPQSIAYGVAEANNTLKAVDHAIKLIDHLGAELDVALQAFPERFREPSPNLNPLGRRKTKVSPARPVSSGE